ARFKSGAGAEHQVSTAHGADQAGACLYMMRVLVCGGGDIHVRLVTGDFLRQCLPLGFTGKDIQCRCGRTAKQCADNEPVFQGFHDVPQKLWAPCAPRLRLYCSITWLKPSRPSSVAMSFRFACRRKRENSDAFQVRAALCWREMPVRMVSSPSRSSPSMPAAAVRTPTCQRGAKDQVPCT